MTGELWSQPPLGVAESMFPKRSATSRCTVPATGLARADGRLRGVQRRKAPEPG